MTIRDENIVSVTVETPNRVATTIRDTHPEFWIVLCEGGCGAPMYVGKTSYRQVDYSIRIVEVNDTQWHRVDLSAPHAMSCATCGPNV